MRRCVNHSCGATTFLSVFLPMFRFEVSFRSWTKSRSSFFFLYLSSVKSRFPSRWWRVYWATTFSLKPKREKNTLNLTRTSFIMSRATLVHPVPPSASSLLSLSHVCVSCLTCLGLGYQQQLQQILVMRLLQPDERLVCFFMSVFTHTEPWEGSATNQQPTRQMTRDRGFENDTILA